MRVRASMAIVLSNSSHMIDPALLILMSIRIMRTRTVRIPKTSTVNRLLAGLLGALHIRISVSTCIPVVGSSTLNNVGAALLVAVHSIVILAVSILSKRTEAVHRLDTALRSALLVSLRVRAAVTVVGHTGRDLVDPAALVLVVVRVMVALSIRAPSANAVHGLAAFASRALNLAVLIGASSATEISDGGHLVGAAALISVAILDMVAAGVRSPLALAIHRLAAARLGALLKVGIMRASIAVVQGLLGNLVHTAALVLVIGLNVPALIVSIPGADAVNRLGTLLRGALLKVVRVRASMAVVLSNGGHLVVTATLVLVSIRIMSTLRVLLKVSNAVDGLSAQRRGTLNVSIRVGALVTTVFDLPADYVGAALLVDVLGSVVVALRVFSKVTEAVHRLGTALRRALLEGMCVRAAVTVVGNIGGDLVDPAAPVLVVVGIMEAVVVLSPSANAINRLAALVSRALHLAVLVRTLLSAEVSQSGDRVGAASLVLVAISNMLAGTE